MPGHLFTRKMTRFLYNEHTMSETEKNKLPSEKEVETTADTNVNEPVIPSKEKKDESTNIADKKKATTGDKLRKVGKNMPVGPGNFWNNMLSTVLLLIFITAAFSYLTDTSVPPEELTISDVVGQVKNNEVKEIIVRGAMLEVTYRDETRNKGEAKRETDASVSDSLTNLGVSAEQLATIAIDVQRVRKVPGLTRPAPERLQITIVNVEVFVAV